MENVFAAIIVGHLAGDYLFQSRKMSLEKSQKNWQGFLTCFSHCLIYTAAVCAFLGRFDLAAVSTVFLSHFPIDFWSLGQKWLDMIKGRNIIAAHRSVEPYHEIDLIFSCIVYVVVDNALHLILLYWLFC